MKNQSSGQLSRRKVALGSEYSSVLDGRMIDGAQVRTKDYMFVRIVGSFFCFF